MSKEIYIVNNSNPQILALELGHLDSKNKYIAINSTTPKEILLEIENQCENKNKKNITTKKNIETAKQEHLLNEYSIIDLVQRKMKEANIITDEHIKGICHEFYENFVIPKTKSFRDFPNVEIIKNLNFDFIFGDRDVNSTYGRIFQNYICEGFSNLPFDNSNYEKIFINNPYANKIYKFNKLGGVCCQNYALARALFYLNKNPKKSNDFWKWYKKTLDVLVIDYDDDSNTFIVLKKPDEIKISEDNSKVSYKYGDEKHYLLNGIEVPKWLYQTPAEKLKHTDFLKCKNADVRAEFIKKAGINKLVQYGTVIDTYENYPDNEMWAKSEYKIIDMHEILPPRRRVVDTRGRELRTSPQLTYAPFLYMKNQTTGVYHLEGIHPRCTTLYDALKMRYRGLNIINFDIKDIK